MARIPNAPAMLAMPNVVWILFPVFNIMHEAAH
jgi:hypothetical protein